MPSLASVVTSPVREVLDAIKNAKSSKLATLQSTIRFSKRKISLLQSELSNQKSAETLVMQKMNAYVRMEDLNKYYTYDRYQAKEPIQAKDPVKSFGWPGPEPRIIQSENQINKELRPLYLERERIGKEILSISREIQIQQQELNKAQAELKTLGVDVEVYAIKDSTIRRAYTEVYMLYQVHTKYQELSTDALGKRKYNSEGRYAEQLKSLAQKFSAYAERNPYVLSGELVLNLNDPGLDINGIALRLFLDRLRLVMGNNPENVALDDRLKKFTKQLMTNSNDTFISKELTRQIDSEQVPPVQKQYNQITKTSSRVIAFVNQAVSWANDKSKIYTSWTFNSQSAAIKGWFSKYISGVYGGMPYCEQKEKTADEKKQEEIKASQAQAEQKSVALIATQFAQTKKVIDPTELQAAVGSAMEEIYRAITDVTGKGISASYSLVIENNLTFTGSDLYQVRILHTAFGIVDYLINARISGNLTEENYNQYINSIQTLLQEVKPPFWVSNSKI